MQELFVDENTSRGYLFAVLRTPMHHKPELRKALNLLRMPGQSRIHFVDERNSRRREILSVITSLRPALTIITSQSKTQKVAREQCLRALLRLAQDHDVASVTLERDESVLQFDRRILFEEGRAIGPALRVRYHHESPRAEPLLWVPDAIAWSFAKGGDWRRRVLPLIDQVIRVD